MSTLLAGAPTMLDIGLVTRALEGPGHDVTEVIVDDILRLAQGSEYQAAGERAGAEIAAGSTDVRLLVAFLLGVCAERGPAALPAVLEAIADALSRRWEAIRPEARRARHVDAALCLLFRSIKATIDFHERARDATWRAWAGRVTDALPAESAAAAARLETAIGERVPSARCVVELAGLRSRTDIYCSHLPPVPAPPPPEAAPSPPEPPAESAAPDAAAPEPAGEGPRSGAERGLEISPALAGFIRKLEIFSALVDRGDMCRAAIVAQDIKGAVDRFDPRVYLPRLLTPHFRLLSTHIEAIAPHWATTASPSWQALEQLYHVDVEAFLEP